jgi:hypothetical protein
MMPRTEACRQPHVYSASLNSDLRGTFVTSVRSVNTTMYLSAYSKAFAAFSPMSGTSRFVLIRARAGVK